MSIKNIINTNSIKYGIVDYHLVKNYNPYYNYYNSNDSTIDDIQDPSLLRKIFINFLKSNNIVLTSSTIHNRKVLSNNSTNKEFLELDFTIPNTNIGIEINDLNTHTCIKQENKYYHYYKSIKAKESNIRLIHLWEWELRNSNEWDRLSTWLLDLINTNNRTILYPSDYSIKLIDNHTTIVEEKNFLNSYHLQGYIRSDICLGIYENSTDTLVQLMTFGKPRYNRNYQYELIRLCTKYGYTIVDGSKNLLKYFIKYYNPINLISYCNIDKFSGNVYEDIGFKLVDNTEPKVIWCNKEMRHFNQSSLTMIGADKLLNLNYGKGTSNEEIVLNHGYLPIYNCGLYVFSMVL